MVSLLSIILTIKNSGYKSSKFSLKDYRSTLNKANDMYSTVKQQTRMGETRNIYNVAVRKGLAYGMVGRITLNLPSRNGTQAFGLDSSGSWYELVARACECCNGFLGFINIEIFLRIRKTL
jgi:hypothetical protein